MPLNLAKLGAQAVNAVKMTDALRNGKYGFYAGGHQPACTAPNGFSDPTGVTGDINRMTCSSTFPVKTQYHVKGTQTLLAPLLDVTDGLEVTQDQTNGDGIEHLFGALGPAGAFTYTIGVDNPFLRMKMKVASVAGTITLLVGFRKTQAFQAAFASYTDFAAINIVSGAVKTVTNLANAGVITTTGVPTWADNAVHEILVKVVGTQVGFFFDGVPLSGIPAFNFAAATVIAPFFFFIQAAGTTKVWWREVEVGLLRSINALGQPS